MPEQLTLGERFKRLRALRGWKQKELIKRLRLSKGMISAIENGHRGVTSRKVLEDLAQLEAELQEKPPSLSPDRLAKLEHDVIELRAEVRILERMVQTLGMRRDPETIRGTEIVKI